MNDTTGSRRHASGYRQYLSGCFLGGCFLAMLLLLAALPASARSWRIADFNDNISVGSDGSALIEEEITLVFVGPFQGIHRIIPIEYPDPQHYANYSLFLRVRDVTDQNGRALKYTSQRHGAYLDLTIYIPGAVDTTKTVRILYTVPNAIRYFSDHDELYWNVTGNDWPVPIDHASALAMFPAAAAGSLRAQAFTGFYGSAQAAGAEIQGSEVEFQTTNPLPIGSGLTIAVYLPKGILQPPSALTRASWFLRSNSILFLPLLALVVMFAIWWLWGRDPDPGQSVAPMYEPPAGMTPAEVGSLVCDAVEPRDLTATIVDLAVRGFLKIEETKDQHLLWSNKDYLFHLLKPRAAWKGLPAHEMVMLQHMFELGDTVALSSLKNRFYVAIPVFKHDVLAVLKEKGMYSVDPESAGAYVVAGAILIGAPFVLLQYFGVYDFFQSFAMAAVAIALAALIVVLFGRKMSAKSLAGARTKVKILGFQEFMMRVDAERLQAMPADTFEKFLPYAMALGVEHRWAQAFQGMLHTAPQWYSGAGVMMWSPILFTNSMHTMSTDMHTVMTMAPRASSSGSAFGGGGFGGGGGGFSGGGFGGGGGGAF